MASKSGTGFVIFLLILIIIIFIIFFFFRTRSSGIFLVHKKTEKYLYVTGSNVGLTSNKNLATRWQLISDPDVTGGLIIENINAVSILGYNDKDIENGDPVLVINIQPPATSPPDTLITWKLTGTIDTLIVPTKDETFSIVPNDSASTLQKSSTITDESNIFVILY